MPAHRPPRRTPRPQAGFTLLEMMAVVLILGMVLVIVPVNLDSLGSEGKLRGTANSLVAAINGARDRAILDAYEVHLELGSFRGEGDEYQHGWRFKFTSVPPPDVSGGAEGDLAEQERQRELRARDREWLYTTWYPCQGGVRFTGISQQRGNWDKIGDGSKPFAIRFFADGTVESGLAIRLVNEDMETDREYKTVTLIVNGLTSEASWELGETDLPQALPAANFGT